MVGLLDVQRLTTYWGKLIALNPKAYVQECLLSLVLSVVDLSVLDKCVDRRYWQWWRHQMVRLREQAVFQTSASSVGMSLVPPSAKVQSQLVETLQDLCRCYERLQLYVTNWPCEQIFHQWQIRLLLQLTSLSDVQECFARTEINNAPHVCQALYRRKDGYSCRLLAVDLPGVRTTTSVYLQCDLFTQLSSCHSRRSTMSSSCGPMKTEQNRAVVHSCVPDHPVLTMTLLTWKHRSLSGLFPVPKVLWRTCWSLYARPLQIHCFLVLLRCESQATWYPVPVRRWLEKSMHTTEEEEKNRSLQPWLTPIRKAVQPFSTF